ncbi:MAG: YicC family protein [Clostridia bacterium]|nr:YicC family protein [Clostridia bacterium]
MKSMTGFGKFKLERNGREIGIEIKSVNHKALDLNIKTPKQLFEFEDIIRQGICNGISRGHVDVFVSYVEYTCTDKMAEVDVPIAESYMKIADDLSERFGIDRGIDAVTLMKMPEVIKYISVDVDESVAGLIGECINAAVCEIVKMRTKEGEKLYADIRTRMATVSDIVEQIRLLAPDIVEDYRAKLRARITELLGDVMLDESKLANEVAFFADKSNIDEEITRLDSHIGQFNAIIEKDQPVGKELDYLIQELNRECNTICSKANCLALTQLGLRLKNEIEKIREQTMNVE